MFHHTVYVYRRPLGRLWTARDESRCWCSDLMTVAMAARWGLRRGMSMQGERVNRKLSLSHATAYPRLTLDFPLSSLIFHINTSPPQPHQPVYGPRRSSYGSMSCKGPSLGQQGRVRNSDSLSGRQASMANNKTAMKDREPRAIVLLLRGTCWRLRSSSASVQWPNKRFNKSSFQL